ncbi:MAG: phosphatidate cytidylyltransferase [candidate division Zixibacteria bacterium]|nr:phosphatidate cytidylyltransferase [candidate division Zixibacteria bacterium]
MSKNLIFRILVAIVAMPIILWIIYQGGGWLFGMVLFLGILGITEFLLQEGFYFSSLFYWLGLSAVVLSISISTGFLDIAHLIPAFENQTSALIILLLLVFVISTKLLAIGKLPPRELFRRSSNFMWGVIYIGLLYPFVYKVGEGINGISGGDSLLLLFSVLWISDSSAMGFGKWLGKHKLAPSVSPNKTIEGFIGGIVGSVIVGLGLYFWKFQNINICHIIIVSLGCSISGQIGDLVESMWKRSLQIKDSSNIIPGHGGILDRFDSLLFAAPFMYLYFHLMLG